MKTPDAFERILASLYDAMLDETRWPATLGPDRRGLRPDRQWPHGR